MPDYHEQSSALADDDIHYTFARILPHYHFVFDATYKDVKERLAQFTPEVQNSYFGQILDKQLLVLKNIEVGFAPAEFTVTDKDGRKVSLSDYKGKYVLIYHWGLCPSTFWVNPKITDLYQKYHEKGLEVLGFTRDDLLKSLQGSSEEFKKDERVQGLLSHPWTTVYTEDEGNGFIVKDLYFSLYLFFKHTYLFPKFLSKRFFTSSYAFVYPRAKVIPSGEKYPIRSGNGITLGEKFWMPDSGEASFSLIFPLLPPTVKVLLIV